MYRERRFSLRLCTLELTDGTEQRRGVVIHPGSVVLVPVTKDGEIILIRNRRWQLGRPLIELAAGTREADETPAQCAARELGEETGYRAQELLALDPIFALPGLSTEIMHPFLARGLTLVGQALEADEDIDVLPLPIDEVRRMLANGEIRDAKSMAVLGRVFLAGLV